MAFQFHTESYAGSIKEIALGSGEKAVTVGGETCYPFYAFEGSMPHKPKIAMEVWDMEPEDWPESAKAPVADVLNDPATWAKKCVDEFGADMIVLQMKSTDPNDRDTSPEQAAQTVKNVAEAIDVPLVVWGTASVQKDEEILKKISEECQGKNLIIGPVEEANHKGIGASAMGFGHTIISSSPIDVNLAKQINILLENLGMPSDRVIIDPTTGGLGYGLEYSYSVMERIRMAAMAQGDDKLQYPIINNIGNEVWKSKEAKQSADEAPTLGDPEKRGILMEAVAAVSYLMAGSDILILRHPESVRIVRSFIGSITNGTSVMEFQPVSKMTPAAEIDFAALSPQPDLTIEAEKEAGAKPAAAPKAPETKPAPKEEAKPAAPAPPQAAEAVEKKADDAETKAETERKAAEKAKTEAEAKAKAERDAAEKAEAEKKAAEKAKAEAEARAAAEKEAAEKAKAEAQAKAKAEEVAKREAEEDAIRQQRAKEREDKIKQFAAPKTGTEMTAAKTQKTPLEKLEQKISWVNRRI